MKNEKFKMKRNGKSLQCIYEVVDLKGCIFKESRSEKEDVYLGM